MLKKYTCNYFIFACMYNIIYTNILFNAFKEKANWKAHKYVAEKTETQNKICFLIRCNKQGYKKNDD